MTFWDMSRVVESKTQNVFFRRSYNIIFYKIDYPQSLSPKLNKKEHSKILLKVFEFSIKEGNGTVMGAEAGFRRDVLLPR